MLMQNAFLPEISVGNLWAFRFIMVLHVFVSICISWPCAVTVTFFPPVTSSNDWLQFVLNQNWRWILNLFLMELGSVERQKQGNYTRSFSPWITIRSLYQSIVQGHWGPRLFQRLLTHVHFSTVSEVNDKNKEIIHVYSIRESQLGLCINPWCKAIKAQEFSNQCWLMSISPQCQRWTTKTSKLYTFILYVNHN
jgi:hypothetical protein